MKIRIITIHFIPNFGSIFQSYGLYKFIKDAGFNDVRIIDYRPSYFSPIRSIRSFVGYLLNYKYYRNRKRKFDDFLSNNIELTKKYSSLNKLNYFAPEADLYISGGDQLWNPFHPCGRDDAYKLSFVTGKKISYSTSLGQTIDDISVLKNLKSKIGDYSNISVREECSVTDLKKVGLDSVSTVDPVFLLDVSEYKKFVKPVNVKDDYLLVYLVEPSELLDKCIDFLSKKYKLKVVSCSGFSKKFKCDFLFKDLGPDEILSYIANAKIVLSASFHATIFSILFKKQFFTLLPGIHTNERITNILNKFKLNNRIVTDFDTQLLCDLIDYSKVKMISKEIEESKKYLLRCLNDK